MHNHAQYLTIGLNWITGNRCIIAYTNDEEAAWRSARLATIAHTTTAVYSLVDTTSRHFSIDEQYMPDEVPTEHVTGERY